MKNNLLLLSNSKKLDITYDNIFKGVFGKIENERFTKKLLELILGIKIYKIDVGHDIATDAFLLDQKVGILDVQAIINDNIIVDIEMQRENKGNMQERTQNYGANLYVQNIKKGQKYQETKEIILINILNYKMNKHPEYISKTVTVLELHKETHINTKIHYYFIELPKLEGKDLDMEDELVQWLVYMYGKDKEAIDMALAKNTMLKEIDREVHYLQGEEAERRIQQLRDKWDFQMYCSTRDAEERGMKKGEKKGIKKGKKEGELIGIRKGEKRGEKNKTIEIIKKMLKQNVSKENIMKFVGINEMELAEIIEK